MLKINKQTITLTKGDDASLRLVPRYKDKTEYMLTEGDSAVFRIKFGHTLVELDCTLNLETNKIVANITPNDTKDFNPGIYRYEAELITSFGFHYTFMEYEQRITSTSNGNSSAVGGNLPEIDGIVDGEPVVYGDIQPTNPMMDYEELNHLPKLNGKTIKGDKDNEYYGIPTKTSDLENDSDFVSDDDYVHTDNNYDDTAKNAVDALGTASTYDVPESGNASTSQVVKGDDSRLRDNRDPNPHTHSKADITDFPTNVSAFNNDSGFITNTVNNLANYYLKSETYTRAEVEQLIAAIKQGKFEIVAELPASGDANVIYLVPKSTAQTSNSYDEYVYINNAWEKIGDTDIDLSGYVTDDELTTALQSYLTTSAFNTAIASYYTKTETDNLLTNKVDKVAGKGLSTNDYDNTAKGIVDGVTSALNDKVDKVQGKGLSTNDYDNTANGVTSALADKVDKVNGKGLSTEDYTTAEKSKLGDISDNAKKVASSSTNGHIEIDDVDTTVYDDTAVQTAIDNIEDELSTDYATVEGNPLNFTTKSAQNSKSTILSVEPIQDLHGYDKPWVGGAGKNKLPMTVESIKAANTEGSWNGLVYTPPADTNRTLVITLLVDEDNNVVGIKANGNCGTHNYYFNISTNVGLITETNYNLTGTPSGLSGITSLQLQITGQADIYDNAVDTQFTPHNASQQLRIIFVLNKTVNNIIFYPMIRLSTETDATFQPYTNECGISGRSEIGILGCGKNLVNWKYNPFDENKLQVVLSQGTYTISPQSQLSGGNQYIRGTKIDEGYCSKSELGLNNWDNSSISGVYYRGGDGIVTFNVPEDNVTIEFGVLNTDGTVSAQLELGSSATDYSPYTESNDLTISLGQTVYGGTLDVENGVLVVDDVKFVKNTSTMNNGSSIYPGWENAGVRQYIGANINGKITDIVNITQSAYANTNLSNDILFLRKNEVGLSQEELIALAIDVEFILPLATPITINLTPHTINLLKGVNNISTDGDKITLTYRDGSVATLGDLTSAVDNLDSKIDESKILTDTATGDKYILVVTNGTLSIEQVSN